MHPLHTKIVIMKTRKYTDNINQTEVMLKKYVSSSYENNSVRSYFPIYFSIRKVKMLTDIIHAI